MVSRREWYERCNQVWPDNVPVPTAEEAVRAARKLYRFVKGHKLTMPIRLTSGRRFTWAYNGVLNVNPNRQRNDGEYGWHALVHDLSHLWGGGHSKEHARLEARMRKEVLRRGWLAGALKPKPKPEKPPVDVKALKLQRVVIRLDRWLAKKRRAERAMAKLLRQKRRYERELLAA